MQYKQSGDMLVIRLGPGENVNESLLAALAACGVKQGIVLSGIGQFRDVKLGFLHLGSGYAYRTFPGVGELLSMVGNVSQKDGETMLHLHVVLARDDFSVFGGHFTEGFVTATLEVAVQAVGADVVMERRPEAGMMGLYIS